MKKTKLQEWIEAGRHSEFTICNHRMTPEEATTLLDFNSANRRLRPAYVIHLTKAIKERWKQNYSPIVVSRTPVLLDGQHRLAACVRADTPFVCDVRFGALDDNFTEIDCNKTRGVSDFMTIMGSAKGYESLYAGALSLMWRYDSGRMTRNDNYKMPREVLAELSRNNEDMLLSAPVAFKCYKSCGISKCATMFLHYRFSQINEAQANAFFGRIASGLATSETDPTLALIRLMNNERARKKKMGGWKHLAVTIKAWNAFRSGRGRTVLAIRDDEDIPAIQ